MTAMQPRILIVDDNRDNCDLLEDIFEDEFDVKSVLSGQECLDILEEEGFDLVLLDVNMPKMDGYEVCKILKGQPKTAMMPVVFVSALASPEERLRGYEVGAEDYVTKPFKSAEITDVVQRVMEHHLHTVKFEKQSKEAMNTAFQAMTNSAELGTIIRFLQNSYTCKTIDQLIDVLFETTQSFGLNSCLMVRAQYGRKYFGCAKDSIEAKVLERFHEDEKILNFGARTLINEPNVSLLVKNMPLDREEDYGRIKDNLVVLLNGTQARVKSLDVEYQLEDERNRGIQAILLNSHDKLQEIHALVAQQKSKTAEVVNSINTKIEQIIFSLGLDEAQEQAIIHAIDNGVEELSLLAVYSEQVEQSFMRFIDDLDQFVTS